MSLRKTHRDEGTSPCVPFGFRTKAYTRELPRMYSRLGSNVVEDGYNVLVVLLLGFPGTVSNVTAKVGNVPPVGNGCRHGERPFGASVSFPPLSDYLSSA